MSLQRLIAGLLALLLGAVLGACSHGPYTLHESLPAFGGQVEVVVIAPSRDQLQQARQLIQEDLQYMDEHWYAWREGPLARVNGLLRLQGQFSGPPSLLPMITLSKQLYRQSGGLFNPALGELFALWRLQPEQLDASVNPDPRAIAALLHDAPTMDDIRVDGILLHGGNPHLRLDLSGIAKGYALGQVMQHLQQLGVSNALLRAGDDIIALGSDNGRPWLVALPHPEGETGLATLALQSGEALSSATAYRRSLVYGGVRYAAIIDPRTGYPARGTRLVSVIHPDPAIADAAATALFIAGPEGWQAVARAMGIDYVVLVDEQGQVHLSPAMQQRLQVNSRESNTTVDHRGG